MKVLFVGPQFPLPAHSGGQIATLETLRSIEPLCELHLLVPPPEQEQEANQIELQRRLPNSRLHTYSTATPRRFAMYVTAVNAALTGRSYWECSWYNPELRAAVERLHARESYDAVHCEWLQPAVSLRGLDLPLVIRALDVHFIIMEAWAETTGSLRRGYWRAQAKRFRRFEASVLAEAPAVVTLSTEDEELLRGCGVMNSLTIPPPRALEPLHPAGTGAAGTPLALFIGRLDMAPNRQAFFRFTDEIWPRIRQETQARVRIIFAGGLPADDVRRRAAECGIQLRAPLSDAEAHRLFGEAALFFSPITSGTGIKIKTLDAMARGMAMLGFPGAFRGVPVENGSHAMIAETPAHFAQLFEQLIDDAPRRQAIGAAARDLIRTAFDPVILGKRLLAVYAGLRNARVAGTGGTV